jgi:three-Cys-motif partner protein
MRPVEEYAGREQTYLKHFFLEHYLERVAYNIGSRWPEFVYVDGFSGPWRSKNEAFEDTSFMIAIRALRRVREGWAKRGRNLRIRCMFIEKNPKSFRALKSAVEGIDDIEVRAEPGEFETLIPEIVKFVGSSFSLVFIDPTGWLGLALPNIRPLLKLRGEVVVNFMFDYVNRFEAPAIKELCGESAPLLPDDVGSRERALVQFYAACLKRAGSFAFATFTPILKPLHDRTYFYLVYATRHEKGLVEFRTVEKKLFGEQAGVRDAAKRRHRIKKSGQHELLLPTEPSVSAAPIAVDRAHALDETRVHLQELIGRTQRISYESFLNRALEMPFVWPSDVEEMVLAARKVGVLSIEGMGPREKTPKRGHVLVRRDPHV